MDHTNVDCTIAETRGAAYGLIGYGFQFPESKRVATLNEPARWASWPGVLEEMDEPTATRLAVLREVLRKVADPLDGAASIELSAWQDRFNELFGHAVRGKCPPYELEYGRSEIIQQASELADIAGFYAAFGMELSADLDDRPDHITVECEFMSVLCAKEAHAIGEGLAENVEICRKAQRDFLRDHLARWFPAFARRVQDADPEGYLGALAAFSAAHISADCRRLQIELGPQTLELRPADPLLDTSISCGPGDCGPGAVENELVQIGIQSGSDGEG